jgi:hypothetical protein
MIVVTFVFALLLWMETPAQAYLDPGTGSMVMQLVLGGLAGAAVLLRLFWRRLLTSLGIKRDETPPVSR